MSSAATRRSACAQPSTHSFEFFATRRAGCSSSTALLPLNLDRPCGPWGSASPDRGLTVWPDMFIYTIGNSHPFAHIPLPR